MKTFREIVSCALIGGAALALSAHAVAAETKIAYAEDGTPFTRVDVSDLDLSKSKDVHALYLRVQDAAAAVCDSEIHGQSTVPSGWRRHCVREAVSAAIKQIDNEVLTALHNGMPQRIARL